MTTNGIVLGGAFTAAVLSPLGSTMIAVALPAIGRDLAVEPQRLGFWVVASYLVVSLLGQAPGGRLGDRIGLERAVVAGVAVFAAGVVLGMLATSLVAVAGARVLMAAGGAVTVPAAMALVRTRTAAGRRARAFGVFSAAMGLAAASGPWLGGVLVDAFGWRAVFTANLPVIALSLLPLLALTETEKPREAPARAARGVAVRLLGRPSFAAGNLVIGLQNLALYTLLFQLPIAFAVVAGSGAAESGRALLAMLGGMVVCALLGGRLAEYLGARATVFAGSVLALLGLVVLWKLGTRLAPSEATSGLALLGIGFGLSSAPSQSAAMDAALPEEVGVAAGMLAAARSVGGIAGLTLLASPAEGGIALAGYGAALFAAAVAALWLPGLGERPTLAPHASTP